MNTKLKVVSAPDAPVRISSSDEVSSREMLASTHTEELVIALCGPIGSPMNAVANKLKEVLRTTFGYDTVVLRLDRYIEDYATRTRRSFPTSPAARRLDLIGLGDEMRRSFGAGVLAELAVNEIRRGREQAAMLTATGEHAPRRVCHVIDTIKNPQELDLLRTVYRELLYVIGVFAPIQDREAALRAEGLELADIGLLMDRSSGEETSEGQTVEQTFPQSDFFLRMDSYTDTQLRLRVERFLHLILGTQIITPTRSETAMYAAASVAGNSACLSRQVGAAVTDSTGEVLGLGWNDVPRPFGDLYVTDLIEDPAGHRDKRCWNFGGKCHNDEEKALLASHVIDVLAPLIKDGQHEQAALLMAKNKKLRGLIEFSRAIHAEMHALLTALRQTGERVKGGMLFVTTYPCHVCARHIVAAGISEVHFIEPYRKSLAIKLHGDAMTESGQGTDRVMLIPYDGVAPARYLSLFKMKPNSRKKMGRVALVAPHVATPKLEKSLAALPALEALVTMSLRNRSLIGDQSMPSSQPEESVDHETT